MWRAWLADTQTGIVRASLPLQQGGSATLGPLNGSADTITLSVAYEDLQHIPDRVDLPWASTLLLAWDETLVAAAVVDEDPSQDEAFGKVTFKGVSLQKILSGRIITSRDYAHGEEGLLAASEVTVTGGYGDMIWQLLEYATARPGGALPITRGTSFTDGAHTKTYKGWNVANNDADKLIRAITDLQNGPDIRFDPEWVDSSRRRFHWVFRHGFEGSPGLGSGGMYLDSTAPQPEILDVGTSTSYEPMSRIYGVGSGSDEGTLLTIVDSASSFGGPWLEMVHSESDVENAALLREKTEAVLAGRPIRLVQVQFRTFLDDLQHHPARWPLGSLVYVNWADGWRTVPPAIYAAVVLKRTYDLDQESMTTDVQFAIEVD